MPEIDPQLLERIETAVHESLMQIIRVTVQVGFDPKDSINMVRERLNRIEMMTKETGNGPLANVRVSVNDRGRRILEEAEKAVRRAHLESVSEVEVKPDGPGEGLPGAANEPGGRRVAEIAEKFDHKHDDVHCVTCCGCDDPNHPF